MLFRRTISFKLAWVGVIAAVVLGAAFSAMQLKLDFAEENRRIDVLASQILTSTKRPASQAARELDTGLAKELVGGVFLYEIIASARIVDERGMMLGEISQPIGGKNKLIANFLDTKVLNYQTELYDINEASIQYGTLFLTIDREKALSAFFDRSKFVVLSGLFRNIALAFVLFVVFQQILTKPLLRIINQLQSIDPTSTENPRTSVSSFHAGDELYGLSRTINAFADANEYHLRERVKKEAELERYRAIVASSNDFLSFVTSDFKYAAVSDAYARSVNRPLKEIIGKHVSVFVGEDIFEKYARVGLEKALGGIVNEQEHPLNITGPASHTVFVRYAPYHETDGSISGVIVAARDITQEKRAADDIQTALFAAEVASDSKSHFLANMSHELRSPLNAIIGFGQILSAETFGPIGQEKYKQYALDITLSGEHLLELITDILDVSRIESGATHMVMERTSTTEIIQKSITIMRGIAAKKKILVNFIAPEVKFYINCDDLRIRQVVVNLLSNAIKFSEPNSIVQIKVFEIDENQIEILIKDDGCGIAAEDIPRALEPFGQVGDIYTREKEGSGLGLYLAKSLTELNGGTMHINSTLNVGTSISIKFNKAV